MFRKGDSLEGGEGGGWEKGHDLGAPRRGPKDRNLGVWGIRDFGRPVGRKRRNIYSRFQMFTPYEPPRSSKTKRYCSKMGKKNKRVKA